MPISFLPKVIAPALPSITPQWLHQKNIQLLMLDFDNTIVPYTCDEPTPEMAAWLETMSRTDITVCVVSNSKHGRVQVFCEKYGLGCITHARKPFPKGIRQCLQTYGIPAKHSALVGDQIFTDVLGANGCGVCSIVVKAIDNHTIWLKLRHVLELPFLFLARKRKI